jgi:hypothetical protein
MKPEEVIKALEEADMILKPNVIIVHPSRFEEVSGAAGDIIKVVATPLCPEDCGYIMSRKEYEKLKKGELTHEDLSDNSIQE